VKYFIFFLFLFYLFTGDVFARIVDFGVQGPQYKIEEINGQKLIEERIKDLNVTKLEKTLTKKAKALYTSHLIIKRSMKDTNTTRLDVVKAGWTAKAPNGKIVIKKGQNLISKIPKGARFSLCFVDFNVGRKIMNMIVKSFGKKCLYMVNNINSLRFQKIYHVQAYPLAPQNYIAITRFHIKVMPTKIIKFLNKLRTITLSVKRLKKEAAVNAK